MQLFLISDIVTGTVNGAGFDCRTGNVSRNANGEGIWNKVRPNDSKKSIHISQVVAHLEFIEETIRQTKDMEKMGNETSLIGIKESGNGTRQMGEQDTGNLSKQPYIKWNGLSQSWEHTKESDK